MITKLISKASICEIGISINEVYGVPLAIANPEGNLLFVSANWSRAGVIDTPEIIRSLVKNLTLEEMTGDTTISVIPMKFNNIDCAYAIADFTTVPINNEQHRERLLLTLKNALKDISVYSTWGSNKKLQEVNEELSSIVLRFQQGQVSQEDVLKGLLGALLNLTFAEQAVIAIADKDAGTLEVAYDAGDADADLNCIKQCGQCGLGWWSLHEKQPLIVKNPNHDPRCRRSSLKNGIKAAALWPLYLKDKQYGVLFLAGSGRKGFEPEQREYIDVIACTISFILDNTYGEIENCNYIRKISALNEISRILNSSLDLNTILNLLADMSINLFSAQICCVYLTDLQTAETRLMAARGVNQDQVDVLAGRFNKENPGSVEMNPELVDFPFLVKNREIGYLSIGGIYNSRLSPEDRELVKTFTHMAGIAIENSRMFEETKRTLMETITVLSLSIEARDKNMFGHSEKVRELAVALAEVIGLPKNDVLTVESAGLLHDIGKLGIPEATLNKAGSLNFQEHEDFKRHPLIGAEILSAVSSFDQIKEIVKHHHERFDGRGYPEGLRGQEIPLGARILAVADTFASLIAKRSYRLAREPFEALDIIKENAGRQFDPELVRSFETVVKQRYTLNIDLNRDDENSRAPANLAASELGLTDREAEILSYIAAGMNNKEISAALFLSEKTVKAHVTHILKKLNLPDRTKAAVYAIQKGLLKVIRVD